MAEPLRRDVEQPTLAQRAYEAYRDMLRLYLDGETPPPAWETLKPKEHAAWTYVAMVVERQVVAVVERQYAAMYASREDR